MVTFFFNSPGHDDLWFHPFRILTRLTSSAPRGAIKSSSQRKVRKEEEEDHECEEEQEQ